MEVVHFAALVRCCLVVLLLDGDAELLERLRPEHLQELLYLLTIRLFGSVSAEVSPRWLHLISDQLLVGGQKG